MRQPTSLNYRFEDGEWWYYNYRNIRVRCPIKRCGQCQDEFPANPYHAAKSKFCSRACGHLANRGRRKSDAIGPSVAERNEAHVRQTNRTQTNLNQYGNVRKPQSHQRGYLSVWVPEKQKYVLEQRVVMECHLGRGVRDDNRLENLELWTKSHPCGQRVEDKVAWAKEILALYEPSALSAA